MNNRNNQRQRSGESLTFRLEHNSRGLRYCYLCGSYQLSLSVRCHRCHLFPTLPFTAKIGLDLGLGLLVKLALLYLLLRLASLLALQSGASLTPLLLGLAGLGGVYLLFSLLRLKRSYWLRAYQELAATATRRQIKETETRYLNYLREKLAKEPTAATKIAGKLRSLAAISDSAENRRLRAECLLAQEWTPIAAQAPLADYYVGDVANYERGSICGRQFDPKTVEYLHRVLRRNSTYLDQRALQYVAIYATEIVAQMPDGAQIIRDFSAFQRFYTARGEGAGV